MKVWNYTVIIIVIALLLSMAGIPIGSSLLSYFGITTTSVNSNNLFYLAIFGVGGILVGITIGMAIGFLTRSPFENYVILPLIVTSLSTFGGVLYGIIEYALANYPGWISGIVMLILAPLTIGYIFALVEFFRGGD